MKKTLIVTGIVVVVLIAGFFVFNRYIYDQKQGQAEALERYRGILTGEYVCPLPSGESRLEGYDCAYALKTDQGEYFVVDFVLMSQDRAVIEGIFSVTDSVEIL